MYKVKFYKRDRDYIYLMKDKKFLKKFLTFFELYCYVRDNNIDWKDVIVCNYSFYMLFYHFIRVDDMENYYLINRKNKSDRQYNSLKNKKL